MAEIGKPREVTSDTIGFHYGTGGDEDYSGMVDNSPDRHRVPNIGPVAKVEQIDPEEK